MPGADDNFYIQKSCICDSKSENDECRWCDCCPASEEDRGECCSCNCFPGNSGEGCCHGDSDDSSCAVCLPCLALRDCCKEGFCSSESESTECELCKPCQYVSKMCKEHCCYRDPEETCFVNCMGVICNWYPCQQIGVACSWIICCIDVETPEQQLYMFGKNWELVCRPCDVFMCDCCPKCSQCHIMPFFCSREYPYCLDFCDCCRFCVSLYDLCEVYCVTKCNRTSVDMCGCYITECMTECCGIQSCSVCRCYNLRDCCNFCIEGINARALEARNKPQCCQKFNWCCLELRWKGSEEQALKELAGDLCRRGYTLQVLDTLGTVIDPQFYREAILSQPLPSNDPSPDLGYTDSYGGYVNFPENQKAKVKHKLGRYTSTPAFGRRSSRVHNIPAHMTRSLPAPTAYTNKHMMHDQDENTEETILYNERLYSSDNITHISTPLASSTHLDSFYDPEDTEWSASSARSLCVDLDPTDISDESERESRVRLKLAKDRETEAKDNIKSNDQKIKKISKKLEHISETRLDTSGLDTYFDNLTHKLSKSGVYPKSSRKETFNSPKEVDHGASRKCKYTDQGITKTPSRSSQKSTRKILSKDFSSGFGLTQTEALKSVNGIVDAGSTCPHRASRSSIKNAVSFNDSKTDIQHENDQENRSVHRHHKSSIKIKHKQSDGMHRQSSKKVRIDTSTLQNDRQDSVVYENEVDSRPKTKRHRRKSLLVTEDQDQSTSRLESTQSTNNGTRKRSTTQPETAQSTSNDTRNRSTIQSEATQSTSNGARHRSTIQSEATQSTSNYTRNRSTIQSEAAQSTSNGARNRSTIQPETDQSTKIKTTDSRHKKKILKSKDEDDNKAITNRHRKKRKKPLVNDEFLPLSDSYRKKKNKALEQTATRPLPLPPVGQRGDKETSLERSNKDKSHKQDKP